MSFKYTLNHLTAGFVTVLVGFTASVALVLQAAKAAGGTDQHAASWVFALCLGMSILGLFFSLKYRIPILIAWSTPGAALLILGLQNFSMSEAIGAFVGSAALTIIFGITGWFQKFIHRIPLQIASAMLAGVLFKFGLDVFINLKTSFSLGIILILSYLVAKRFLNRYTMVFVLVIGMITVFAQGGFSTEAFQFHLVQPLFIFPTFSVKAFLGLSLPLFIVTMTAQNIPGIAILRAHEYHPPTSKLISGLGFMNLILAPFGAFALNLAAITAAISMGSNVDPDPKERYKAAVTAGLFYLVMAAFAGSVAVIFSSFPQQFVMTIAGLALLGTIGNALSTALSDEKKKESALITFLVAISGVQFLGVAAAFWSLIAGLISYLILESKKQPQTAQSS